MSKNIFLIIGAGGIACQALPALAMELCYWEGESHLIIMDGDVFEEGNTARQFLARENKGANKAEAMVEYIRTNISSKSEKLTVEAFPNFITPEHVELRATYFPDGLTGIWVMADNHPARRVAVELATELDCPMISSANETDQGEAWVYHPEFAGTEADPLVRYPEIATTTANDPAIPKEHCTDVIAVSSAPQLPSANLMAGAAGLLLFNGLFAKDAPTNKLFSLGQITFNPFACFSHRTGDLRYPDTDWKAVEANQVVMAPAPAEGFAASAGNTQGNAQGTTVATIPAQAAVEMAER